MFTLVQQFFVLLRSIILYLSAIAAVLTVINGFFCVVMPRGRLATLRTGYWLLVLQSSLVTVCHGLSPF
jgi:formate hydrogenlyase subunit 4